MCVACLHSQDFGDLLLDLWKESVIVKMDADQGLLLCFPDALQNRQDPVLQIQA